MSASIVFHLLAALVYGALGSWLWQLAARSRPGTPASATQYAVLALGIALHGAGLSHGVLPQRGLYLGWALAMSAAIWLGMVVFWFQSLFIRIEGLRLILLPAA